jgi:hypothetical protein
MNRAFKPLLESWLEARASPGRLCSIMNDKAVIGFFARDTERFGVRLSTVTMTGPDPGV